MSKYNYASEKEIIGMVREKALSVVERAASNGCDLDFITGTVHMANVIIDELQKDDSDDGK